MNKPRSRDDHAIVGGAVRWTEELGGAMSTKHDKKKGTTKGRVSKTKKARKQSRAAAAVDTASTSVLVDNKSLIIRSLLGKSA